MITNERQYRIATARLDHRGNRDPDAPGLREEVARYEGLRDGRITGRRIVSLEEIPTALVEARIAAHLTQRDLAELLGVAEQQVQRWEACAFRGVGIARLQAIADALRLHVDQAVTYHAGASRAAARPLVRPDLCRKHIGAAYLTFADSNVRLIQDTFVEASARAGLDWSFTSADGHGTPRQARAALRELLDAGCDLIYLEGIPPRQVEDELARARSAGVPVVGGFTADALDHIDDVAVFEGESVRLNLHMVADLSARLPRQEEIRIALVDSSLDIIAGRRAVLETVLQLRVNRRIRIVDAATIDLADPYGSSADIAERFLASHAGLDAIWTNYPVSASAAADAVVRADRTDAVAVYGHIANVTGVEALRAPDSPMRATSWVDLDYTTYATVGGMLDVFAGRVAHDRRSIYDPVPVTVLARSTVDMQVHPADTHWVASGGAHRDAFVARWEEELS